VWFYRNASPPVGLAWSPFFFTLQGQVARRPPLALQKEKAAAALATAALINLFLEC